MTLKLLVADDSVTIRKVVGLAFAGEDVAIESASNGDSALDKVRTFKPDIVLADVFMPVRSGYGVCERIKEDPELAHIPVVLLVGTFEPFDESEASRVKCNGYLTKPFDTSELIQTVRSLVGEKMLQQKNNDTTDAAAGIPYAQVSGSSSVSQSVWPGARRLVSSRAMESFLGSNRILDLFGPDISAAGPIAAPRTPLEAAPESRVPSALRTSVESPPAHEASPVVKLSDQVLNTIVDKVVRRMSVDVIREVAWEVVPDLSEVIIRRTIEEHRKP